MEEGEPIEHKLVTRAIGTAQKRVETRNFEIRKHLLEYDDVMNKQREIVYGIRRQCLEDENQEQTVLEWMGEVVAATVARYAPADAHPEDWDWAGLNEALHRQFDLRLAPDVKDERRPVARGPRRARHRPRSSACIASAKPRSARRCSTAWSAGSCSGSSGRAAASAGSISSGASTCSTWITSRRASAFAGYGQRDPLTEYKKEAFDIFQEMIEHLKEVVVEQLFKVRSTREEAAAGQDGAGLAPARQSLWQESRGNSPDVIDAGARADPPRHRAPSPARSTARRSAATICAPAARARSTRSAAC